MTEAADDTDKCEFCDKRGLPLLLVRDALVPFNVDAPVSSDTPFEVPATVAKYTRRVLRNGFVNVYDEARKRWESYYVTGDGYYFRMPLEAGVIPVKPHKPFNCSNLGHRAVASCITVPDPTKATKVWIGFSDVIWTNKVRERNEKLAYRQKHMVAVDIAAVLAGGQQAHCRPISQVSAIVAEYALPSLKAIRSFTWNTFQFNSRENMAARLLTECETLRRGKAQIVTVPDPVGIVSELALLLKRNADYFNTHPGRSRQLKLDMAIAGFESTIKDNAVLKAHAAAQRSTNQYDQMAGLSESTVKRYAEMKESMADLSDAQRKKVADDAWEKYAEKINDKERQLWQADYKKKLAAYSKAWVDPLATAHVEVMKSSALANYFETNFDETDVDSGEVYVNTVSMCVMATQDKPACAKLYAEWIHGVFLNKKNLLLRSLIVNQEKLAKAVDDAVKSTVDLRAIPWDNLIGLYGETLKLAASNAVAKIVVFFGGAIAHVLGKWIVDGSMIRGSIFVIGMISGRSLHRVELTDHRVNFRKLVAKQLIARSGLNIDPTKLSQAISDELFLQGVSGKKMPGQTRATWIVFVDKVIKGLAPGATEGEKIAHVIQSIRTVQSLEAVAESQFGRVRTILSTDLKAGILAVIIQCACFTKLIEEEAKAQGDDKLEARWKWKAGVIGICGTALELLANFYRGVQTLRLGATYTASGVEKFIKGTKAFGIFGALIVACFDTDASIKHYKEDEILVSGLYAVSAVAGVGLGACMAFPGILTWAGISIFTGLGVLFLAVAATAILIEVFKDNKIEDWLERTFWGTLPSQRFANEEAEQKAYLELIPKA